MSDSWRGNEKVDGLRAGSYGELNILKEANLSSESGIPDFIDKYLQYVQERLQVQSSDVRVEPTVYSSQPMRETYPRPFNAKPQKQKQKVKTVSRSDTHQRNQIEKTNARLKLDAKKDQNCNSNSMAVRGSSKFDEISYYVNCMREEEQRKKEQLEKAHNAEKQISFFRAEIARLKSFPVETRDVVRESSKKKPLDLATLMVESKKREARRLRAAELVIQEKNSNSELEKAKKKSAQEQALAERRARANQSLKDIRTRSYQRKCLIDISNKVLKQILI